MNSVAPTIKLFGMALLSLVLATLVIWLSIARPWYGMTLVNHNNKVQLLALDNASAPALLLPLDLLAVGDLDLTATDLMEEPDLLDSYTAMNNFRTRQQRLTKLMQDSQLQLTLADSKGVQHALSLHAMPSRPLSSLPFTFWVQLVTGIGGFIIGAWVLALRPTDAAARSFMLTGAALMLAAFSAAIYSTRELALPTTLWLSLTAINHAGSVGFGFALASFFMFFPQPLLRAVWVRLFAVGYLVWLLLELTEFASSPTSLMYVPVLLLSGLIVVLIGTQWWQSRRQPQARAALRWLGLTTFVTIALFLALAALPALFDTVPLVSQGGAFGFFLIFYAGLALGLRRYRLFELDHWAFHVLLWALAGLSLILVDLLFISLLDWQQRSSLMASLLVCGFLYLPLRSWLWRRLIERPRPDTRSIFNHIIEVALAPSAEEYQVRWQTLLNTLYTPSQMQPGGDETHPQLREDGLSMSLPRLLHSPPLTLTLADKGRRLFTPRDLALAVEVCDLLAYANDNRDAWQKGAREERARIAQDLHDDLGSRLLTGLHQSQLPQVHDTIGLALADMRSIVRGLAGQPISLTQVLAELREENLTRCDSAGITLDWPSTPTDTGIQLDYQIYRHLLSVLRELLSNTIRHAGASRLDVRLDVDGNLLTGSFTSDGTCFDGSTSNSGHGLANLRRRVDLLGGSLQFLPQAQGTQILLAIPLTQERKATP